MSGEDDFGLGVIQGQRRGHGCHVFEDLVVACRMLEKGEEILALIIVQESVLEDILERRIQGGHENIIRGHPVFPAPFQYSEIRIQRMSKVSVPISLLLVSE
jgi:hypothetical protein